MKTKKMFIGLSLSFCGLLILAGCSGFNQDPFKGKSDAVRNAVPTDSKLDFDKSITDGAVQLVLPDVVVFREGVRSTLDLKVKTFLSGYAYSFEIINADQFKNATISSANQLSWSPEAGTIQSGRNFAGLQMKIKIIAKPGSGAVLQTVQTILVYVENDMTKPVIKSVNLKGPLMIEEGSLVYMTVIAQDLSSSNTAGMMPTVISKGKLEPYIKVTSTRYLAATNEWEFEVTADLTTAEVTRSIDTAPLNFQAVDRFGTASIPYSVNFTILTKFGLPMTTFSNSTTVKAGVLNTVAFQIYDGNNEAILTLTNTLSLPMGASINCENSTRTFQQCTLSWNPPLSEVGKSVVTYLEIQSKSTNAADTRVPKSSLPIQFKVVGQ